MIDTEEKVAFTLDELEPKARQRAIEKLEEANYVDYEIDVGFYKEELAECGCSAIDLYYNIGYSQGDGAAFDCLLNLKTFAEYVPGFFDDWLAWKFAVEGGYLCTTHINASSRNNYIRSVDILDITNVDPCGPFEGMDYDDWQELLKQDEGAVSEAILEWARDKAKGIYNRMVEELEYVQTEEYIVEQCEANNYTFDEQGQLL